MSLNPLSQVKDYASMLNRIFLSTLLSAAVATWLFRTQFAGLDELLAYLDIKVDMGMVKQVPLGYLIPAVLVAGFARMIKLHDRISDLVGIRARFDVHNIIQPLGRGVGLDSDVLEAGKLKTHRRRLMREAFYRYASSTDPKIDRHLIYEALDWWSWFWVLVESLAVWSVTAIVLLFAKQFVLGLSILGGCAVVVGVMLPLLWAQCARYAHDEVEAILSEDTRKEGVRKAFTCVTGRLAT